LGNFFSFNPDLIACVQSGILSALTMDLISPADQRQRDPAAVDCLLFF